MTGRMGLGAATGRRPLSPVLTSAQDHCAFAARLVMLHNLLSCASAAEATAELAASQVAEEGGSSWGRY